MAHTADAPTAKVASTSHSHGGSLAALSLGALGIVFGDIGTSPLYTLSTCLKVPPDANGNPLTGQALLDVVSLQRDNVLGVISLIFWALTMVVLVKYLGFIMRADNRGEGGILALLALVPDSMRSRKARVGWVALLVIAGAALLYGDGIITPAISVLSAMEGLKVAATDPKDIPDWVIVVSTVVILVGLFAIQSRGTGTVGKLFGPIMIVWFLTIAALGVVHLAQAPGVLSALNPMYGVKYFVNGGGKSFWILGAVVLAVTGGEALYADMGHFGARPIRLSWLGVVMPSLVLCYLGQGALFLRAIAGATPDDTKVLERVVDNPFFAMIPAGSPLIYVLVVLSALATIIASQALISGAFSLTHQAIQLGYFPRVAVLHTSKEAEGQIYVPFINWALMIACLGLVVFFQKSEKLAAAYGIAVSGTMAITSVIFFVVTRSTWRWPLYKALPVLVLFLSFDLPFFVANADKFLEGGFIPVIVGAILFLAMVDWKVGRSVLRERLLSKSPTLDDFMATLVKHEVVRVKGTAIVAAATHERVPPVLVHQVSRVRSLHSDVVLLTVVIEHVPIVDEADRMHVEKLAEGFSRVVVNCGFMEKPNIPILLAGAKSRGELDVDLADATYIIGRETFLATSAGEMGRLTEGLFAFLARNARTATAYFGLPPNQVVELGTQIDL